MAKAVSALLLICLLLVVSGCVQNNTPTQTETTEIFTDGAAILFMNGKEYVWVRNIDKDEFTIENLVGEVITKVSPDTIPDTDFSSNVLEVGTEIYSVKEKKGIFLAKIEDGEYSLFEPR